MASYNHFDKIKVKVILKNNRCIINTEDSDLKISLYQSSIGTGLKAVPKSIDFYYC